MPRPSLKDQRSAQILDAYEACVARYGVEAATLKRIATEAGLARPLIRHNVGNRDDLLDAMFQRFLGKSDEYLRALVALLPESNRVSTLIEWLFDEKYADSKMILVANSLIAAAPEHPQMARQLRAWIQSFIDCIAAEIKRQYQNAEAAEVNIVATGIAGIYFNVDTLSVLGDHHYLRYECRQAAKRLASSLKHAASN